MNIVMPTLRVLLMISLVTFVNGLVDYIRSNRAIEKTAIKIYKVADKKYKERKEERERIYLEEGNIEEKSIFYKLDLMIEWSGLRNRFKNLTTEIYLTIVSTLVVLGFFIGSKIGGLLLGVGLLVLVIINSFGIIYILSGKNYGKIDKEIIPFVNLMENYAVSDNDIVNIMGNVYQYLEEPLRGYIEKFYDEAINSGDCSRAFMNLENKIENARLRSIIRNIEICSRNEANYDVIIQDERRTLKNYSKSRERNKTLIRQGRKDVLICLLINAILLSLFYSFTPNLIYNLFNTFIGNIISFLWIIVLGICGWYFVEIDKGDRQ